MGVGRWENDTWSKGELERMKDKGAGWEEVS
jgi:hypothetical protein